MGLFEKYFSKNKQSDIRLSKEFIINLITISKRVFEKERSKFEKGVYVSNLVSPDIPAEYQETEIAIYEKFLKRYLLSSGIISIVLTEYLISKHFNTTQNKEMMNSVSRLIFSNLLKIRADIISGPKEKGYSLFFDEEKQILDTEENYRLFTSRIQLLIKEMSSFIDYGGKLSNILDYFSVSMGQILPELIGQDNEELEYLVESTIKKVILNYQEVIDLI